MGRSRPYIRTGYFMTRIANPINRRLTARSLAAP